MYILFCGRQLYYIFLQSFFSFFSNYQQFQNRAYKIIHSLLLQTACVFSSDKFAYTSKDLKLYFCSLRCGLLKIFGVVNLKKFKVRRIEDGQVSLLGKILVMLRDPVQQPHFYQEHLVFMQCHQKLTSTKAVLGNRQKASSCHQILCT